MDLLDFLNLHHSTGGDHSHLHDDTIPYIISDGDLIEIPLTPENSGDRGSASDSDDDDGSDSFLASTSHILDRERRRRLRRSMCLRLQVYTAGSLVVTIIVLGLLALAMMPSTADAQEILAISSYVSCVQLDPTVSDFNQTTLNGSSLNCQTGDGDGVSAPGEPPVVTTVDLRMAPNSGGVNQLVFNLSVVADEQGTTSVDQRRTTNGTQCSDAVAAGAGGASLCRSTSPTRISIETSNFVYRYELRRRWDFDIPYCYLSYARFNRAGGQGIDPSDEDSEDAKPCRGTITTGLPVNSQQPGVLLQKLLGTSEIVDARFNAPIPGFVRVVQERGPTTNPVYCDDDGDISDFFEDPSYLVRGNVGNIPFFGANSPGPNSSQPDCATGYEQHGCDACQPSSFSSEADENGLFPCNFLDIDHLTTDIIDLPPDLDRCQSQVEGNCAQYSEDVRASGEQAVPVPGASSIASDSQPGYLYQYRYRREQQCVTYPDQGGVRYCPKDRVRGEPSLRSQSPGGYDPSAPIEERNLWWTPNRSPNDGQDSTDQVHGLLCQRSRCTACQDTRAPSRNQDAAAGVSVPYLNPDGSVTVVEITDANSRIYRHALQYIVPLRPSCAVYDVVPIPQVVFSADVRIESDRLVDPSQAGNPDAERSTIVETIHISNVGDQRFVSSASGKVRVRVEDVDTADGYIGPTVEGLIVVCGRGADQNIGQGNATSVEGQASGLSANGFLDMTDVFLLRDDVADASQKPDPITNPWDDFIDLYRDAAQSNPFDEYVSDRHFFPHPLDYSQLPGDQGRSFWHYVPETLRNRYGRGCGQVGITSSFYANGDDTAATQYCRMPTHACVPGMQNVTQFYGRSYPPCNVSGSFHMGSGLFTDEMLELLGRNATLERRRALRFMPGAQNVQGIDPSGQNFLYNTTRPGWWLGGPGTYLYYEPSPARPVANELSTELILDVVGDFVGYEQIVAPGRLIIGNTTTGCAGQQETGGLIEFRVQNLSPVVGGVAASYRARVDCQASLTGIGLTTTDFVVPGLLQPQEISSVVRITWQHDGRDPSADDGCLLELFPATTSQDILLDERSLVCQILPPVDDMFMVNTSPPVVPTGQQPSCGICDLDCKADTGELASDPCIIVFVYILPAILITILVIVLIYNLTLTGRKNPTTKAVIDNINRVVQDKKKTSSR